MEVMISPGSMAVNPGSFEKLIQGQPSFSLEACHCDFGSHCYERRCCIGRRGGVAKVPSDRAHIADLNIRHYLSRVSHGRVVRQDVGMGGYLR